MTRLVNTSVSNIPFSDIEAGAPITAETVRNIWADIALLHDMLTGKNAPPRKINHTGNASGVWRGCLLGGALASFMPELPFNMTTALSGTIPTFLVLFPVFVPDGEQELTVRCVFTDELGEPSDIPIVKQLQVFDASFVFGATPVCVAELKHIDVGTYEATCTQHTSGAISYIAIVTEGVQLILDHCVFSNVTVYVNRMQKQAAVAPTINPASNVAMNVATAGARVTMALQDTHAALLQADAPLDAWHLSQLAANINTLTEYVTAAPVAGDAVTLAGDDTLDAFASHTGNGKADEAIAPVCLCAFGTGAIRSDCVSLASAWGNGDAARYNAAANTMAVLSELPIVMQQGATRNLKLHLLGADMNTAGGTCSVKVECFNAAGVSAGSVTQAATLTTKTWKATVSNIPYHAGVLNRVVISVQHSKPKSSANDFAALGCCLYHEATT